MQKQYLQLKKEYSDYILLFRLGDFYEAFYDDAVTISKILGITLTGRGKDQERIPMAGIPYHALSNYLPKLVEHKLKIAIADQMEEARPGKLVDRKITKIITPGTVTDDKSLESDKNNFLASIVIDERSKTFSFAYVDISTGEFYEFSDSNFKNLIAELNRIKPSEVLCDESTHKVISKFFNTFFNIVNFFNDERENVLKFLKSYFNVYNLHVLNIDESNVNLVYSVYSIVRYLQENKFNILIHITKIQRYSYDRTINLGIETIRNLEIFSSGSTKSLFDVLNMCVNPMGRRLLRKFLITPLKDPVEVENRLEFVDILFKDRILTHKFREFIKGMPDLERFLGKIGMQTINPKEMYQLGIAIDDFLRFFQEIKVMGFKSVIFLSSINTVDEELNNLKALKNLILNTLKADPSINFGSGDIFRESIDRSLDELVNLKKNIKQIIAQMQLREIQKTGISSLKIGYNNVFGYYIEVTKTHLNKVPSDYIRKQTLANAERFITQELKELEEQILTADEKIQEIEQNLYLNLLKQVGSYIQSIEKISHIVALFDVLSNFAYISREYDYSKPEISDKNEIIGGRHPVLEQIVDNFVPNDTSFEKPIHIITGPNMAGKSTYIRSVALIYLLAQIGCFVPAKSFKFSVVDNIFTRIGAGDNLTKGESTFMVEMIETAHILNNATQNSLIILDEIGRGTSTYDGISIAWSIIEYIQSKIGAKTMFATHYHEITELEKAYPHTIKNYQVLVADNNKDIEFLYKIGEGAANKSYGIHVAKMAGIPEEVVSRSKDILLNLEQNTIKTQQSRLNILLKKAKNKNFLKTDLQEQFTLL